MIKSRSIYFFLLGIFVAGSVFSMDQIKSWKELNFQEIEQLGNEDFQIGFKSATYNKIRFIKAHKKAYDDAVAIIQECVENPGIIKPFLNCTAQDIKNIKEVAFELEKGLEKSGRPNDK